MRSGVIDIASLTGVRSGSFASLISAILEFLTAPRREYEILMAVAIDQRQNEHWLLSDGHWAVRLDLCNGTLLGGPVNLEHRLTGIQSAKPKIETLRHLVALTSHGELPASMLPRERRATHWILELRVGDALLEGATQQEMARVLFGTSIAPRRWRLESASFRLRVQRLVRTARRHLDDPLAGPWFG
jgi:hypothetical protein